MSGEFSKNSTEISSGQIVQNATIEDIENILTIQAQKIIIPKKEEQKAEDSGFLVYPIFAEELERALKDGENHVIKVAKEEGKVIGYIISYDLTEWTKTHPGWLSNFNTTEEYKEKLKERKVLYGRHIAVDKDISTSGVGKELLDSTLQEAINRDYEYFIVETLKKPIANRRSANFVQKMGFKLVGQTNDDDRIWSVFLKDLTIK
ncbi:MAG: GNAT family N-acetyltransferase [bacterium]|nr:GNAT family N-acetyltransferase [bacterium]